MSKKKWILLIIAIVAIGYLLLSKIYPGMGQAIDATVGPTVSGFFNGIYMGIVTHPIWIQYDVYFALIMGGVLIGLLVYKGRDAYDSIRGIARIRATDGKTSIPTSSGSVMREPTPVVVQETAVPTKQNQPTATQPETKQEATS